MYSTKLIISGRKYRYPGISDWKLYSMANSQHRIISRIKWNTFSVHLVACCSRAFFLLILLPFVSHLCRRLAVWDARTPLTIMTLPFYGALFRFYLQLLFSSRCSLRISSFLRILCAGALSYCLMARGFVFRFYFFWTSRKKADSEKKKLFSAEVCKSVRQEKYLQRPASCYSCRFLRFVPSSCFFLLHVFRVHILKPGQFFEPRWMKMCAIDFWYRHPLTLTLARAHIHTWSARAHTHKHFVHRRTDYLFGCILQLLLCLTLPSSRTSV